MNGYSLLVYLLLRRICYS